MPSLGADMEHGKIVEWLVKPGDYVRRGDLVAVVDTDKTVMDVECFQEGVVAELLVDLGVTVPVGTPLARITQTPAEVGAPGPRMVAPRAIAAARNRLPRGRSPRASPHCPSRAAPGAPAGHRPGQDPRHRQGRRRHAVGRGARCRRPPVPAGRVRSSPRARRLAAELGIELSGVTGTGPDGAVTEADVRRAAGQSGSGSRGSGTGARCTRGQEPAPGAPRAGKAAEARDRVASLRRAIGTLMSRSKKTIPHYYLSSTLDLRAAVQWMQSVNAHRPVASRLVPSALLLKAAALAAKDVPEVNGFYDDAVPAQRVRAPRGCRGLAPGRHCGSRHPRR